MPIARQPRRLQVSIAYGILEVGDCNPSDRA